MNPYEEQDYTKQFDMSLWKKIFSFVYLLRKEAIALMIVNIFIAIIDVGFPLFTKYAIDTFITKGNFNSFNQFIAAYSTTILLLSVSVFLFIYLAGKIEVGLVYYIRKAGFAKLQELSFSYYDKTPVGWIMARMTTDAQRIGDVIAWAFFDLIWGFLVIIMALVVMLTINLQLALILIASTPVLIAISLFFQKRILAGHREVRKINSKITGSFNEGINGARTTKTLVSEDKNFEEFSMLTGNMRRFSVKTAKLSSLYQPIVMSIGSITLGFVLWTGGSQLLTGIIGFGTLSLFVSYAMQIFDPIQQIARIISEVQSAQASAERTMTLLETEADIVDTPHVIEKYGDALLHKTKNWEAISGNIEFRNVSFSYKSGEKVLTDFNLYVVEGERIALVGETGSGKSTIVNLICRFYEPTVGTILIDGTDYKERSQLWLHSNLGYVLQTPHLFSGTIRDNIKYAKPDVTEDEIIDAAKTVNAYQFIMKLEKGFDTEVGEGGNRLSTGERQLISFARAIIAKPKIFILDEATSSIDTETEQVIQQAIDNALSGKTCFIVAHRLSTIRSCDRILVIDNGRIAEMGSHKQLLRLKGMYYNLYTNQFKSEAENKELSKAYGVNI